MRIFIIDPRGVDVLSDADSALDSQNLLDELKPYLIGASRRSIRDAFWSDIVEHKRLLRFFDA